MTIRSRTLYYVVCDECPNDPREGPDTPDQDQAFGYAITDGWNRSGLTHICPTCQQRRVEQACVANGGHHWPTKVAEPFSVGETGWIALDDDTAFRRCGHCPRREWWQPGLITGSTGDSRPASRKDPGETE